MLYARKLEAKADDIDAKMKIEMMKLDIIVTAITGQSPGFLEKISKQQSATKNPIEQLAKLGVKINPKQK